jgi:hypothetical protein
MGLFCAFLALGLANAELRWLEPRGRFETLDLDRPVEVVAVVAGHPVRYGSEEIFVKVRSRHLRQRRELVRFGLDVFLSLPAGTEPPGLGAVVRLKGYLRRSAGYANNVEDEPPRPGAYRMRLKSARFLEVERRPGAVLEACSRLRRKLEEVLGELGGQEGAAAPAGGLVRALVLGDRSELSTSRQQVLARWGLSHLLAVSGLHVGLVGLLVFLAGQPLPRTMRLAAALAAVLVYLALVGPRPAMLRASVMALLALGALLVHRPPQTLNALAWSVFVLVAPAPSIVPADGRSFRYAFAPHSFTQIRVRVEP